MAAPIQTQEQPLDIQLNPDGVTPTPTPKSFSLPKKYIILIVILCLASIGCAIYLLTIINTQKNILSLPYIRLFFPKKNILQSLFAPPAPTPTPTFDITNWSTYISTKYGYSIKYPTDWIAKITPQQDPKILEYVVLNPKSATDPGTLSITLSYGTRTYKEALELDPQPSEKITIASVSATKRNHQDSDGNISINVIIPTGSNTIIISAKEQYKDIFNQMLSTIQLKAQ